MTALLLLARPVFAVLLMAVVGLYIWTGYKADLHSRVWPDRPLGPTGPKGQRGQ